MIYYYKIPENDRPKNRREETDLAQKVLAAALFQEYKIEMLPEIKREPAGKPYFPDHPAIQFNYSHCKDEILCGLSSLPVGVDVEGSRPLKERLIKRICHPAEADYLKQVKDKEEGFLSLWVAKEAYVKFLGEGIRCPLQELDMSGAAKNGEQQIGETHIRLWREKGTYRCACTPDKQQLFLIKLENI